MEREFDENSDTANQELEQETIPLDDTGPLPGEGAAVDDV
jgi:hypothetical protein